MPLSDAQIAAGHQIHALAEKYGLVDEYENAPGSRIGVYSGIVNGMPISCTVYDRDPVADLRRIQSSIDLALSSNDRSSPSATLTK